MKTNINRKKNHALLITQEDLQGIVSFLKKEYEYLLVIATCSEGSELKTEDFDEILKYENQNFRRIEEMRIEAGVIGITESYCVLSIQDAGFSSYKIAVVDHDDKKALKVADELAKRFKECKPWYSMLSKLTLLSLLSWSYLLYGSFEFWSYLLRYGKLPKLADFSLMAALSLAIPFILIVIGLLYYDRKVWEWLFPKIWISLGRQIKESEKRAKIRNYLVIGVGATMIIGIAVNIISHYLLN